MSDCTVAIDYTVVKKLCDTMEDLSTRATTLQGDLSDLHSSLQSNWVAADADYLLTNYDEFVSNIDTITQDITSVKEWSEETSALFQGTASNNSSNISAAITGQGASA